MKDPSGKPLNIIRRIAVGDYETFGMHLLQDENGLEVKLIEKDNTNKGAESITHDILQKWLTCGHSPRTYQHLIECLKLSEMCALADLIIGKGIFLY